MSGRPPGLGNIVAGILRLARGRADGFQQFAATRNAFLASFASLLVFSVLLMMSGSGLSGLADIPVMLCVITAPLVLSYEVARLWGREAAWLRFATAFNWCQMVIPVVGMLLLLALGILAALGLPRQIARAGVLGLVLYSIWLHWFLARHGLGLSRLRAALMVVGVNVVTVLIVLGPRLATAVGEGTRVVRG